jgi:hypothetical protein
MTACGEDTAFASCGTNRLTAILVHDGGRLSSWASGVRRTSRTRYTAVRFRGDPRLHGVNERRPIAATRRPRGIAWEAMMVNSYHGIYQAERGKTAAEIRAADVQAGVLAAQLGQLGSALATPVRAVRRSVRRRRPVRYPAAPDAGCRRVHQ